MAGIFEGLKVLELGSGAAGPVATRYLAEQGATVLRIESSRRPDFLRILWLTPDSEHGLDGSPMFVLLNPDKLSVSIDMSKAEGVELAKKLVVWADVVTENFAPGPMEKWGMDYESLRALKPDLVMLSCCLYGQTGPHRTYPGFGGQGSAISGFNHMTGWIDRAPPGPHGTITDSLSPRYVALSLIAALLDRKLTGRGRYIDVAQVEAAVYSQSEMIVRHSANGDLMERRGNHAEYQAPHACFPCRGDDRWVAISVFEEAEWEALRRAMGDPDWARDERFETAAGRLAHQDELDERISGWTRGFDAHELASTLQAAGVAAGVAQSYADLFEDPQLAHRGHYQALDHVHLGALPFERSGYRISGHPGGYRSPGPNLGEHTDTVLRDFLGLDEEEIASLTEAKVLV